MDIRTILPPADRLSQAQVFAQLSPDLRHQLEKGLDERTMAGLLEDWTWWARPQQLSPPGHWSTWCIIAGRGMGKTRAGTEWILDKARHFPGCRIGLIGKHPADYRYTMIEGESGLLACSRPSDQIEWESSKLRLVWANGTEAYCYSSEAFEDLRGPNNHFIWCDEFGKFKPKHQAGVWINARLTLRADFSQWPGQPQAYPQMLITTTPRPTESLKKILALSSTTITKGSTYENAANLAPSFLEEVRHEFEGTRMGRQELYAEILEDHPGALWKREQIEACRVDKPATLERIVVAVDPGIASDEGAAETGIMAMGRGDDRLGYLLEDCSLVGSPNQWARAVVAAYYRHHADVIVAEANQGGEMVKATIHHIDETVNVKLIHAKRGKMIRAEPIAALHEQGKICHVGFFPHLEDQLCSQIFDGTQDSPDRLDAYVHGFTELMVNKKDYGFWFDESEEESIEDLVRHDGAYFPT